MAQRVSSPVVVGRRAEMEQLQAALDRAAAGTPATVVVAGEAGVGKTRLVTELVARARESGALALVGGCLDVGDGVLAYTPVVEALRSLVDAVDTAELVRVLGNSPSELARLVPELGASVPDAEVVAPARLFESLLGVLHRLAERCPVLLVAEDLHWADQSTRDLLSFLVRNLRGGVCLVLTYRSDDLHRRHPLRSFLAELERGGRTERLRLGAMDRRGVAGLLAGILGGHPSAAEVTDILARSGGNPFFAEELLAARREGTAMPTALRDVVLARVEVLSEAAQRGLRVAAVAGRRVDHQLLAAVSAQPVADLVDMLREAVAHHVLTPDGNDSYAFRHALVQEIVYDELLPVERVPLHAAYARALSARIEVRPGAAGAVELGQLAYHWYAAHDLGAALSACVRAGQAAEAAYALAEAQQQYERALELWDQVPDAPARSPLDRVTLLQRAAQAAFPTGDHSRAIALIEVALRTTDAHHEPVRTGALLERLARFHWAAGESARAMAAIERAVATIPTEPPALERARALAAYGQMLMLVGRCGEAVQWCEDAVQVARQVGARGEEGHALTSLASSLAMLGRSDRATELFEQAGRIAAEAGNADDICRVRINHATTLATEGRWADSARMNLECYRLAEQFGAVRTYGASALTDAADALIRLGRLAEAAPMLDEVVYLDLPTGLTPPYRQTRALYHLCRGELAAARGHLASVVENTRLPLDPQHASPQYAYMAAVALWEGRLADARAAVADGLGMVAASDAIALVVELCAAGVAVEATIAEQASARRATAELTQARDTAARLLERARAAVAGRTPDPLLAARLASAESERTRADGTSSAERWSVAAAAWQGLGCTYETSYARWRQGEALLREGAARGDFTAVLRQAWTMADDLGARHLAEEITALARRARIELTTATAPDPAAPPADPVREFGLTAREREVLTHLAAGRTNRQIAKALFISDKTASVHVSNILAKLQAANRGEAAAVAHRLGIA